MEEKIKNFDEKRKKYEDYDVVLRKFMVCIWECIGVIFIMMPVQELVDDFKTVFWMGSFLSWIAVITYLDSYMIVTEAGKTVSVYQKLLYVPVSIKAVFRVRLGYLCGYCKKKLIVYLLAQVLVTLIALRTLSVWNVIYPVLWVGLASFLPGFLRIYPWKKRSSARFSK